MHAEAYEAVRVRALRARIKSKKQEGLDLGGQFVNGSCRELFTKTEWTGLDIVEGPGIDIVTDATVWIPERTWDVVLCTEVLEHVLDWPSIVRVAAEALREGGHLFLTCASTDRPAHGANGDPAPLEGEHYGNVGPVELENELKKYFSQVDVEYNYPPGDAYVLAVK